MKDLVIRENGLIRRNIDSHIMYLDPKDSGISSELKRRVKGEIEREPAFMKTVYDQYENQLADGKQVILTACGFDYVPGQLLAASLMSAAPKP